MANQAPITPAAPAATFVAAQWLSHFESIGGGFLATESQTSLCIACQGTTPESQSAAHAMLRGLTDEQRAGVIAHIRAKTGLSEAQPDLKAVCSQEVSEPAAISPPSSGPSLDQPKGSHDMDMTYSFTLPSDKERPADWDAALAEYEAARAWSDSLPEGHAQEDAAVDAYCDAMDHLVLNVRAPTLSAINRKIDLTRKRWDAFCGCPDSWTDAIQADLAALGDRTIPGALASASHEDVAQTGDQLYSAWRYARAQWELFDHDPDRPSTSFDDEISSDHCTATCDALNAYLLHPAEDLRALALKLRVFRDEEIWDGWTLAEEVTIALAGDAHRLAHGW